jgi:hypothetical protein
MGKWGRKILPVGTERVKRVVLGRGRIYYEYGYRHFDDDVFRCLCKTVEEGRTKRDKWLKDKG